jgi:single-strand DNA-binding protein
MSLNKVILVGNVGKDPVIRYFDRGVVKATFPLATSESYNNQQGETITTTEWHNIVLWRSLAEIAEKTVKKGVQVYIVGKIKTRSYVDKEGNNKYITEILADTLMVLEKKQAYSTSGTTSAQENGFTENEGNYDNVSAGSKPDYKSPESEKDPSVTGGVVNEPPGKGNPFDDGIPSENNEDDLPF